MGVEEGRPTVGSTFVNTLGGRTSRRRVFPGTIYRRAWGLSAVVVEGVGGKTSGDGPLSFVDELCHNSGGPSSNPNRPGPERTLRETGVGGET